MSVSKEALALAKQPRNLGVMQDSCQTVKHKADSYVFFSFSFNVRLTPAHAICLIVRSYITKAFKGSIL